MLKKKNNETNLYSFFHQYNHIIFLIMSNIEDFESNLDEFTAKIQSAGHLVLANIYALRCP